MLIRAATPEDFGAIIHIWNPIIRNSEQTFNTVEKTTDMLATECRTKADNGHAFLVAEDAEGLVGFATYGQFRASNGYRHTVEHTINLAPHARQKGVGRGLMAALEAHARAARAHSMIAGISHVNEGACAFHAALGYRKIAHLPEVGFKFGRWYDLILMQKAL